MIRTESGAVATAETDAIQQQHVRAFRIMLRARMVEDKLASLYRGGKIFGGVFVGRGQEALSVAQGLALRRGDVFAPSIRDQAGRLAFGEDLLDGVRTYLGSSLGPMRGRDGNVHRGRPREGLLAMISHLGSMISVTNGVLFAKRLKGLTGFVGMVSVGDGATSTGAAHEALNQAGVERLPLIVVIANNQYAYSTSNERQFACRDLVERAPGYGFEGHTVQGNDLTACLEVIGRAVQRAREGRGPQMVVARLLRLCGHGEHDDAGYIDPKLKQSPWGRDCLPLTEQLLLERGWATAEQIAAWKAETSEEVDRVVAQVQREPGPDPYREEWRAWASGHLRDTYGGD